MYGDTSPRFFIYWTGDSYNNGCYNLGCSGFVQIGNKYAVGAAITPTSEYNGTQKDIEIYIWKDSNLGRWWLAIGASEYVLGYWPASLFSHLNGTSGASMLQFGGEVVNSKTNGQHTTTQMGSGHFARERFGKAAYFRNLQMVDSNNKIIPLSNLQVREDSPGCYNISLQPYQPVWGCYFYYGGPGRNPQSCP
ncbi:unnamed protein product [Cuscuta epithymum]|uniref:Neprosin PEP catalytic domain-containing protein n=1 Tax=Cuscuta epithymum TaxID=186058 RepID=A0AAV0FWP6_9ASTE|nr:unnamed protein product [Cuscuta epithymum]